MIKLAFVVVLITATGHSIKEFDTRAHSLDECLALAEKYNLEERAAHMYPRKYFDCVVRRNHESQER